jgi:sulfur relay protein TusB/DsrH
MSEPHPHKPPNGEAVPAARLHLLMDPGHDSVQACLQQLDQQDTVLLADRGVELLAEPARSSQLLAAAGSVAALQACCLARGLAIPATIKALDDTAWPAVVRAHRHILSWS